MALQTPLSFRTSQPNAAAMLTAPQKNETGNGQERFERHLNDSHPRDMESHDRRADRREDRRQRDRAAEDKAERNRADDAHKADGNKTHEKDEASTDAQDQTAIAAVIDAPTTKTDDSKKTTKTDNDDKTVKTDAKPAINSDELTAKTETGKTEAANPAPVTTDSEKTESKTTAEKANPAKAAQTTAEIASETAVPLVAHVEKHKGDTKPAKSAAKPADAAPVPQSQTPSAPVDADVAPKVADANTSKQKDGNSDPDAGLTITDKKGLGHEAAAKMAEKTDAKSAQAPQTGPNVQTQTSAQTAAGNNTTAQNFANMVSAASGGDAVSVTSGGNGVNSTATLNDLQSVGTTQQTQNTNTATVRIGTLPGQSTPTQVPAMAIALQVARNLQKGINRFDIRLDPAEMGRIDVRMEVKKDGNVSTHMIVERPETLDLLRRDSQALQQALNNAGLQANPDSLNFSLRDGNSGNNAQNFSANSQNAGSLGNFEAASNEPLLSPLTNINLSANGGIDIRV